MSIRKMCIAILVLLALSSVVGCVGAAELSGRAGEDRRQQGRRDGQWAALHLLQVRQLAEVPLLLAGQRAGVGPSPSRPRPPSPTRTIIRCSSAATASTAATTGRTPMSEARSSPQGPKIVESSGGKVVLEDECLWQQPGKEPIIRDRRQHRDHRAEREPAIHRFPDHPGAADRHPHSQDEPLAVRGPGRAGTELSRRAGL